MKAWGLESGRSPVWPGNETRTPERSGGEMSSYLSWPQCRDCAVEKGSEILIIATVISPIIRMPGRSERNTFAFPLAWGRLGTGRRVGSGEELGQKKKWQVWIDLLLEKVLAKVMSLHPKVLGFFLCFNFCHRCLGDNNSHKDSSLHRCFESENNEE